MGITATTQSKRDYGMSEEIVKIIGYCDIDKILKELENKNLEKTQFSLQGVTGEDYDGGIGRIDKLNYREEEYIIKLYDDMPYTYSIIDEYKLYRTRVMSLKSKEVYSYHKDLCPRIHIPLISNFKCKMVVEDIAFEMPADGSIYLIQTQLYHTAFNGNYDPFTRIHIVGNT
jgi:hypothetical protein